jgi:site-specific recombinase XerD
MLQELFPRVHRLYLSLPILGPTVEDFAAFLMRRGYPQGVIRNHIRAMRGVDRHLRRRRCRSITDVTEQMLRACAPPAGRACDDPGRSAAVRLLLACLTEQSVLTRPEAIRPAERRLCEYVGYLQKVRGLAPLTIKEHVSTASQFLAYLDHQRNRTTLGDVAAEDVEAFVNDSGRRVSRASLQHTIAQLRSLLRYLGARGEVLVGLDSQIDTPRVYRGEHLPRSLPWATVRAFLDSVDRSTALGRRDYAMFQLIVNYGLRASEVADLKLEDIQWRSGCLHVSQRKTTAPLVFPLTDAVANSLIAYLRRGRPTSSSRQVFLRHRAPAGILKPTAVSEAFQAWSRRSGLSIPYQGCHCLRHSYAIHLLRKGASLKTIGDLLGHRSTESTCVYLRLAVEDLREVALNLPAAADKGVGA